MARRCPLHRKPECGLTKRRCRQLGPQGELDDVSAASQESIEPRQSQQEVAAFFINEELANGAFADADKAACQMIEEESPSPLPTPSVEVPDNSESVTLAMGEPQAATLPPPATRQQQPNSFLFSPESMSFLPCSLLSNRRRYWVATKTDGSQHPVPLTATEIAAWGRTSR